MTLQIRRAYTDRMAQCNSRSAAPVLIGTTHCHATDSMQARSWHTLDARVGHAGACRRQRPARGRQALCLACRPHNSRDSRSGDRARAPSQPTRSTAATARHVSGLGPCHSALTGKEKTIAPSQILHTRRTALPCTSVRSADTHKQPGLTRTRHAPRGQRHATT
jgi:hypothetical protein